MTKLCICKICNCGRHRCPHKPYHAPTGTCHLSEYTNRFHPHPIDVRTSFKPHVELQKNDAPVDDKTTHRVDYVRHPLEKPFVRQGDEWVKPDGEMENLTSYNMAYVPKRTDRPKLAARDFTRKEPGKFDGMPTYRNDYRAWDLKPRGLINSTPAWTAPVGKFEGTSNYKTDYIKYSTLPRQSFRPNEAAKLSDAALDDQTMYRKHYVPFELAKREAKAKVQWEPNKIPLDGLTTNRRDYTPKDFAVAQSCKPDRQGFASDAPFVDDTTMRNDYKRWQVERPHHHEADMWVKPKGDMDMNTTHKINYTPKPLDRVVARRPAERPKLTAAFDGSTNYRADFRPWELGQRQGFTMKDVYKPPQQPFEGMATYKAHYVPHKLEPVGNYKPGITIGDPGAFDDNTMYRIDYTAKTVLPCPAAAIDTNPKFHLVDQDQTGHKFYQFNGVNGERTSHPAPTLVSC